MRHRRGVLLVLLASSALFNGCQDRGDIHGPGIPSEPLRESPRVGLVLSARDVPVGGFVTVGLSVEAPAREAPQALQAHLRFPADRLRFLGQVPEEGTGVVLNAGAAQSGDLRFLVLRPRGLGPRVSLFTFEVLTPGYGEGVALEMEMVARGDPQAVALPFEVLEPRVDPTLAGSGVARAPTLEEMARQLGFVDLARGSLQPVAPGGAVLGDCNQDGAINVLDALVLAQISVGGQPVPSDPLDFQVCDVNLDGALNVLDVIDVANVAVRNPAPLGALVGAALNPLAPGGDHSCGLNSRGEALCWGRNDLGQQGDGTVNSGVDCQGGAVQSKCHIIASPVHGEDVFLSLSAGLYHTCGLNPQGRAFCWGDNQAGQLGDGTLLYRLIPTPVDGDRVFVSISAGDAHTCALTPAGEAFCWGDNHSGQLGIDLPVSYKSNPQRVKGGHTWRDISAGSQHSCGVKASGEAACWGGGALGQLGDGTDQDRTLPTPVAGGFLFKAIEAGYHHTCGLREIGTILCWGRNSYGQLGDGSTTGSYTPRPVVGGPFVDLSTGSHHTCALDVSGTAFCWGANYLGQLGDGSGVGRMTPTPVAGGRSFVHLAAGEIHTCALELTGSAFCWGYNSYAQVGDGSFTDRYSPVAVSGWAGTSDVSTTVQLLTLGGSPASVVYAGVGYRYLINVVNAQDEDYRDLLVTGTLNSNHVGILPGSGCTLSGSEVTCGGPGTVLPANSSRSYEITFEVAPLTAGQVLANLVVATGSNDGNGSYPADPDDGQNLVTDIVSTANLLLRWVDSAGTPITSAPVGATVKAQLCSRENLTAFQAMVGFSPNLTMTQSANLQSDQMLGVHPDCAGSPDVLNASYTPGALGSPHDFLVVSLSPDPGTVTKVGIAQFTFTLNAPGTEVLAFTSLVLQNFDGSAPIPDLEIQPLVITP